MASDPPVVPPAGGTPPVPAGPGSTGDGSGDPPKPGTVSYDAHRQLLDEKKKADAKLRELEAEKAERERKELESKGDFEKLLGQEREKNKTLETRLSLVEERETGRRKLAAVLTAMNGHVEQKYFDLIPYGDVIVDQASGEVDQNSVAQVVERVRKNYPEIIKASSGPGLPNAAPQGGVATTKIKGSDFKKLSSAEMRKWKPDQVVAD